MTAEDLLNILEQRQLVSAGILASLRKQVAGAAKPIPPASVIKLLVDKQQLTAGQAEQLLRTAATPAAASAAKVTAAPAASKPAVAPTAGKPAPAPAANKSAPVSLEEEMGLAPFESNTPAAVTKPAPAPAIKPAAQPAASQSLEEELLGLAPMPASPAQASPDQKVVAAPVAKTAPARPQPSAVSLEDELGLSTKPAGTASPTAKPVAGKPAATPAKATAPVKAAAPAKSAAATDLGLEDDLYSDLGTGPGLFDEGLLSAAADQPTAGPLDMPADDPLSSAAAATMVAAPVAARAAQPKRWKKVLAIVASALGVILLAAGIAAAVLLRPTGDPEFQAAERDYKAEEWAAAAGKYSELLRNYPSQVHASAARVHRGLAQLRAELGERPQWLRVLETAEKVLPEIESEPEFSELHADLALILTDLSDALTRSVDETDDPAEFERRVAQGRRALALATDSRYVPPADRPWQRLQAIDDRLAVLGHEVDRPKELEKTVADIRQATAKPDPAAGFALREKLVERFPELAGNDKLQAALVELTAAEKGLVKPGGEKSRPAVREERKTPIKGWTSILARRLAATAGDSGTPALAIVDGALYAFDSGSGKLLWRRYVGSVPAASAILLGSEAAASHDALVVNDRFHDVLRVDAVSGRIKWRQTLDKPLTGPPAIDGGMAYLSTRSAAMHRVDLKTGELTHSVTLPSLPVSSPVSSGDGRHVFQLTARGELFALSAGDLSCAGVLYLGLELGSLAYPPLVADRYVIVVDNYGLHESALRVVALDAAGLPAEVVSVVPIAGRIAATPVVVGNQLIVVNERGTVVALEMTGNRDKPLKKASEAEGESSSAEWFVVEAGTHLWVAGNGWRGFDLQKGRLTPRGKPVADETFDASSSVVGKSIVGVYHRPGQRGAVVFARSLAGALQWEIDMPGITDDAAADAAPASLASLGLAVVDQAGQETQIDLKQRSGWQTLESFAKGIRLPNQKWLWWRGPFGRESILFDPKRAPAGATLSAETVALPVALAGGLLMPIADGALLLVDPASGKSLATPLRPYVIGRETVRWTAPALSSKGTEVLIADDHPTLYEVAVQKDPQPQLVKVAGAELDAPVVAGPVVADTAVYIVTRDGMLRAYSLPGLKPAGEWKLTSRFVPWIGAAGDLVLLTCGDELIGCSAAKKLLWKSPLGGAVPCGFPLAAKQGIVVADDLGRVVRLDATSGKELAKVELDEPLVGGLSVQPDGSGRAITADGCLLEFAIP
jgi:outer membrane protein assembly factor BamB